MTNEYQPLDPKEWLANPDEWIVQEQLMTGHWVTLREAIAIYPDGTLHNADKLRMRRKAKPVVMYIKLIDGGCLPVLEQDATHRVTFGPRQEDCRIDVIERSDDK
jgi:hypothetical protein